MNNCGLYSDPMNEGKCDKGYVASTIGTLGEWLLLGLLLINNR